MGCAQSKVENEESVARCKERKILMKEAVVARNAFAAGHSGYSISLKNTGAALSDYAHGEVPDSHFHHQPPIEPISQPPPPPPTMENLPPPPPLPNFSPSPINRAISMPEIPLKQHRKVGEEMNSVAIVEEDEEEEEEVVELDHGARNRNRNKNNNVKDSRAPQNGMLGPAEEEEATTPPKKHSVQPMLKAKNMAWDYFFMVDNMPGPSLEPDEIDNNRNGTAFDHRVEDRNDPTFQFGDVGNPSGDEIDGVEPKTPEKAGENLAAAAAAAEEEEERGEGKEKKHIELSKTAPPDFRVAGGTKVVPVPSVNLMQVLSEIDDHFLKASESAQEVSKMLEATRLHYHSNFADNRGI